MGFKLIQNNLVNDNTIKVFLVEGVLTSKKAFFNQLNKEVGGWVRGEVITLQLDLKRGENIEQKLIGMDRFLTSFFAALNLKKEWSAALVESTPRFSFPTNRETIWGEFGKEVIPYISIICDHAKEHYDVGEREFEKPGVVLAAMKKIAIAFKKAYSKTLDLTKSERQARA